MDNLLQASQNKLKNGSEKDLTVTSAFDLSGAIERLVDAS